LEAKAEVDADAALEFRLFQLPHLPHKSCLALSRKI